MECQHSSHATLNYHQGDAAVWVLRKCPRCGSQRQYAICQSGWDGMQVRDYVRCRDCQNRNSTASITFVRAVD